MNKHTPGPWMVNQRPGEMLISAPTMPYVAAVSPSLHAQKGTGEANASLISAAPELLEACKKALAAGENYSWSGWYEEMVKAVAKAEGSGGK